MVRYSRLLIALIIISSSLYAADITITATGSTLNIARENAELKLKDEVLTEFYREFEEDEYSYISVQSDIELPGAEFKESRGTAEDRKAKRTTVTLTIKKKSAESYRKLADECIRSITTLESRYTSLSSSNEKADNLLSRLVLIQQYESYLEIYSRLTDTKAASKYENDYIDSIAKDYIKYSSSSERSFSSNQGVKELNAFFNEVSGRTDLTDSERSSIEASRGRGQSAEEARSIRGVDPDAEKESKTASPTTTLRNSSRNDINSLLDGSKSKYR